MKKLLLTALATMTLLGCGDDGKDGASGADGKDGANGADGNTEWLITRNWTATGNKQFAEYYKDGVFHREDGPAVTRYSREHANRVILMRYYNKGIAHRVGGPAARFYKDVAEEWLIQESYYQDNEPHREDGPAFTTYSDVVKGQKASVSYWVLGRQHRAKEEGPAYTSYCPNGNVMVELYIENGELIPSSEIPSQTSYSCE